MKIFRWVAALAGVIALPAVVAAQQTSTPPDTTPYPISSHWLVSGSLGSDFEQDADDPSVDFAGTAGWLWHGVVGGEFQANFSPDFQLSPAMSPVFLAEEPAINSYMLNVIGAAPLMAGGQFQPYVSGGPGWFMVRGDATPGDENVNFNNTEMGWNAGFGLMGFLGQLGVRADMRYFKVSGDEFTGVDGTVLRSGWGNVVDDQEASINTHIFSGASYWRGSVGVALRW